MNAAAAAWTLGKSRMVAVSGKPPAERDAERSAAAADVE